MAALHGTGARLHGILGGMETPDLTQLLEDYIRAQPNRALGGVRALSGFEYQIRSYLADFGEALVVGEQLQQAGDGFANAMETLSDHTRQQGGADRLCAGQAYVDAQYDGGCRCRVCAGR